MTYSPPKVNIYERENLTPSIETILASPEDVAVVGPPAVKIFPKVTEEIFTLREVSEKGVETPIPYLAEINKSAPGTASLATSPNAPKAILWSIPNAETERGGKKVGEEISLEYTGGTKNIVKANETFKGCTIGLTYEYIPSNYYEAKRFYTVEAVEATYGSAFTSTGVVNSPLTYGAALALGNCSSVIVQPIYKISGENKVEGVPKENSCWTNAYKTLFTLTENVDFIVPIIGVGYGNGKEVKSAEVLAAFESTMECVRLFASEGVDAVAVFGEDGTNHEEVVNAATVSSHQSTIKNWGAGRYAEQIIFLNGTSFEAISNANGSGQERISVGGQFAAASFAGTSAGLPLSASMTRRPIYGFVKLNDHRTTEEKNKEAEKGLCVIEQNGTEVRCRHAITCDTSSVARSEVNVVRNKFNLVASLRATIENQIIGKIIADSNSPFVVKATIEAVLASLQSQRAIVEYNAVSAEISKVNPTVISASFEYRPSFMVNYINITFALNLSSQAITVETTPV